MKKNFLSVFMAVCVFSAFPGAVNCFCVTGDCHSVSQTIRGEALQCHLATAAPKGENHSGEGCCGKCRIEKTAVLASGLLQGNDFRQRNVSEEMKSSVDFHINPRHVFSFQKKSQEFPPGFLTRYVLSSTFSFRGPPAS